MAIAKKQIRQVIADNYFTNVTDVYEYLKEGFKDILQELMEEDKVCRGRSLSRLFFQMIQQ